MAAPIYTLKEVVDLERPAWHEDAEGAKDFIYDGIHFWCGPEAKPGCEMPTAAMLPTKGWRHQARCRCATCREARRKPS